MGQRTYLYINHLFLFRNSNCLTLALHGHDDNTVSRALSGDGMSCGKTSRTGFLIGRCEATVQAQRCGVRWHAVGGAHSLSKLRSAALVATQNRRCADSHLSMYKGSHGYQCICAMRHLCWDRCTQCDGFTLQWRPTHRCAAYHAMHAYTCVAVLVHRQYAGIPKSRYSHQLAPLARTGPAN
jgi:hypothetical protein